jgi:phospholipase C
MWFLKAVGLLLFYHNPHFHTLRFMKLLLFLVCGLATVALAGKISHIVVLMEENRSFDHLMGLYKGTKRGTRGKNFTNTVKYNLTNGSSAEKVVAWRGGAPYINYCDPDHSVPGTTFKIFGTSDPAPDAKATMSGFAQWEYQAQHDNFTTDECGVLTGFEPERLPVLTALADNFVLMDNFFASVPGPTWPNRMFFLQGTSDGLTETGPWYKEDVGRLFPGKTIFDQVAEAGGTWKLYYDDAVWELFIETVAQHPENMLHMEQFYKDAADGNLPSFSFIDPRSGCNVQQGVGSNDMHPDHDVAIAEALYRDVYHAIRHSPKWNETLFILTFDEHGGFWDHVAPPKAPSPGNFKTTFPDEFGFDRLGLRIPTLLISPWVAKGTTVSDPPAAQKPAEDSAYDLTSIMASARKILGFLNGTKSLTPRDAWAATFEHVLDAVAEPRTDCPTELPQPPTPAHWQSQLEREADMPINSLQQRIMEVHANLAGVPFPSHVQRQGDVEAWVRPHYAMHSDRTHAWKHSKRQSQSASVVKKERGVPSQSKIPQQESNMYVALGPQQTLPLADSFSKSIDPVTNKSTININVLKPGDNETRVYCLDGGDMTEGTFIGISLCYPSADVKTNRDPAQQWVNYPDSSMRPFSNQSLCVDNTYLMPEGGQEMFLAPCDGRVSQSYAWHGWKGPVIGFGSNDIMFGDTAYHIAVMGRKSL